MAAESIDELVLQINCTDGTLYCSREFLLNMSKTLKHLQKESATPINDVDVPFEKNIFGSLIKFANTSGKTPYTNFEFCSQPNNVIKLISALDWLGPNKELEKSVKERVSMLPISKPIVLNRKLLTAGDHDSSEIFEFIADQGYIVLVERGMVRDFNSTYCNYIIVNDIDEVVEYCLDHYTSEAYQFVPPEKHDDALIMFYEEGGTYYLDGYGVGEEDYEYLFEQMEERLEAQGLKLNIYPF